MFWIGLGIGLFLGFLIGFFTFALCAIAKESDRFTNEFDRITNEFDSDQKKS